MNSGSFFQKMIKWFSSRFDYGSTSLSISLKYAHNEYVISRGSVHSALAVMIVRIIFINIK